MLSIFEVFREDAVLLVLWVLAVFRHLVVLILSIFGVLQDFILWGAVIYSQYFRVLYCEVLLVRVLIGVFYSIGWWSISGFNTLDTRSTPSILDVCTAGAACTRGYALLILPVLAVIRLSVLLILQVLRVFRHLILLILPSTRSTCAVSTAHTPSTRSICAVGTAHTPSIVAVLAPSILLILPSTRST